MRQQYSLYKRFTDNKKFSWYFCYYNADGKRVYKATGKTKKGEARQVAEDFISSLSPQSMTLKKYTDKFFEWGSCPWIQRQHAKGKSFSVSVARSRRSHLDNYIIPKFGNRKLESLNRVEIENWLIGLTNHKSKTKLSNQTKNHILYTFRIVLKEAERERVIPINYLATVESLAINSKERGVFTKDELGKLFPDDINKMISIWGRKEYAYLFYILATTGVRSGEVRALQWKYIIWNDQRNGLRIDRAVKDNGSFGTTKTGHSRVVLLSKKADDYLQNWLKESPFDQMDDLIFFGSDRSRPVTRKTMARHFESALKRAKIKIGNRNLVIHSFRHTYNTLLRPLLPKEVLQSMTGHKSDSMTDRYDHPKYNTLSKSIIKYSDVINHLF
ncbi:tyrosine-type recombinase/integrase [Pleomorphochaeta sp. DL1XJH-081]|uniref:tyrosine-type recombinase/integrase n=1 Tax=Pleomorphochaeta sp. DL1XJH-081 TaxID=3409690 RepID=UPI003BB7FCB1